jgi:cell division septal protein FtsQ
MPRRQRGSRSQIRLAEWGGTTPRPVRGRAAGRAAKIPALILLVGALWVLARLLGDPAFQVHEVRLEGLKQVREAEVTEVVNVLGHSLFTVRSAALEDELMRRFGCVETAEVICRLPDSVTVVLHEQEVVLVWQSGERYWWLGAEGEVLGETEDPGDLLVVRDVAGREPDPDDHILGAPVALARDLDEVLSANRRYDYTAETGLVVYVTAAGWPVYLGHEGDAATKVAIMRALVDELVRRGATVEYIDLRNEVRPTYKPG